MKAAYSVQISLGPVSNVPLLHSPNNLEVGKATCQWHLGVATLIHVMGQSSGEEGQGIE